MLTTLIVSTVISTGLLTWSAPDQTETVDTFSFIMQGPPSVFDVWAWGDIDGQHLLPTFEVIDKDGFVVMSESSRRCAFGWGGCAFGTDSIEAGEYTFYGYLQGLPGTTYNTYFWELRVLDPNCEIELVTAVPEPSTYALMLLGLAGVGFAARRKGVAK